MLQVNTMIFIRKLIFIIPLLLVAYLWAATFHSGGIGCSCCFPNACKCGHSMKMHPGMLFLGSESPEEGSHCHCEQCKNHNHQETFFLTPNSTPFQSKQALTLRENISDKIIHLLNEDLNAYLDTRSMSKFLPLFLLKASFLL